jgi:hypothetical protein
MILLSDQAVRYLLEKNQEHCPIYAAGTTDTVVLFFKANLYDHRKENY